MIKKLRQYDFKKYSIGILLIAIILGAVGAYMLKVIPGVKEGAYLKQLFGIAFGVCLAVFVSLFDYHFIAKFYILMYIFNLIMLFMVKFTRFGISVYGAKRWLGLEDGPSFQPSELTKVIMIVVIAKLLDLLKNRLNKLSTLFIVGVVMAIPTFLVLIQTDLSTSIVLFAVFAVMIFVSGYSLKILAILTAVLVPAVYGTFWYILQPDNLFIKLKVLKTYHQERIYSVINPELYPDLIYQQQNATKAMSSGGLLGKILTGDTGTRGTAYVPVVESDFIFTGIGEELGFVGAAAVILLIMVLAFKIILVAKNAPDLLGKIIAAGCASVIMVQAFINIGVVSWILPNTGIPLPFVSSGLSSVVGSYTMLGMVLNISIHSQREKQRGGITNDYWFDRT